jgi:lysozyme family protein
MANFDIFFPKILAAEGGFVNHPADPGGATNMGITLSTWQQWAPRLGKIANINTLKALSIEDAKTIYKQGFWDRVQGDLIKDQNVAEIIADARINHPATSARIPQRLLNLATDNIVGPATLAAINKANPAKLYNEIREARLHYYNYRAGNLKDVPKEWANFFQSFGIKSDSSFMVFLNGWRNRIIRHFPPMAVAAIGGGLILSAIAFFF